MKLFKMGDSDGGRDTAVVAEDMIKAIELFKKAYSSLPETVQELTEDNITLIVQGILEPEYSKE